MSQAATTTRRADRAAVARLVRGQLSDRAKVDALVALVQAVRAASAADSYARAREHERDDVLAYLTHEWASDSPEQGIREAVHVGAATRAQQRNEG